jgi:hypothetical protein
MAEFKLMQEIMSNKASGQKQSVVGPLLFILHVKDLPPTINTLPEPITFTDYTRDVTSKVNK